MTCVDFATTADLGSAFALDGIANFLLEAALVDEAFAGLAAFDGSVFFDDARVDFWDNLDDATFGTDDFATGMLTPFAAFGSRHGRWANRPVASGAPITEYELAVKLALDKQLTQSRPKLPETATRIIERKLRLKRARERSADRSCRARPELCRLRE